MTATLDSDDIMAKVRHLPPLLRDRPRCLPVTWPSCLLPDTCVPLQYGGGSSQPAPKQAARTPSPAGIRPPCIDLVRSVITPNLTRLCAGRVAEHVPLGTFTILALNLGLFVADHVLHLPGVTGLYLYHTNPQCAPPRKFKPLGVCCDHQCRNK